MTTTSWRETERLLIAALRREGIRIIDVCGVPTAVIELFNDDTGQLLRVQRLFNDDTGQLLRVQRLFSVETLARAPEWDA